MQKTPVPLTFAGASSRLAGVPISLKSSGALSVTPAGTGIFAASAASSPYLRRRPVGTRTTSPSCARQDLGSTPQPLAAAGTSMGLAQRRPRPAHRVSISGRLHAQQGVGIELLVGLRVLELNMFEVDLQLLGD